MRRPNWLSVLPSAVCAAQVAFAQPVAPSQSAGPDSEYASKFGYPTVAAALADLKARPNVSISIQGGWTIIHDKANWTLWSFTPPNHPAHPAGVKRVIVRDAEGNVHISMTALCQAEKEPCDKLVAEFQALNERIKDSFRHKDGSN